MLAPQRQFVDWWLGKSEAQRQAFLSDEATSDKVRDNLAAVEAYCRTHSYRVYCESDLRPRPFAPRILRAVPHPPEHQPTVSTSDEAVWPSVAISSVSSSTGIGGRNGSRRRRQEQVSASTAHVMGVTHRLADFLKESGVAADQDVARRCFAALTVRLLLEAATAAAYRQHLPERVEQEEEEEARRHRGRLKLTLQAVSHTEVDAARGSPTVEERTVQFSAPQPIVARPIIDCQRESCGMLAVLDLLAPLRHQHGVEKRPRDTDAERDQRVHRSAWEAVREDYFGHLRNCAGAGALSGAGEASTGASEDASDPRVGPGLNQTASHSLATSPRVTITAKDVRFAINRVMATGGVGGDDDELWKLLSGGQ